MKVLDRRGFINLCWDAVLGFSFLNLLHCVFTREDELYKEINSDGQAVDPRLIIEAGIRDEYARTFVRDNLSKHLNGDFSLENILVALCRLNSEGVSKVVRGYRLNYGEYLKLNRYGCCADTSIAVATAAEIARDNSFPGYEIEQIRNVLTGGEMGVLGMLKWDTIEDHALNVYVKSKNLKILDMQENNPFVLGNFEDCLGNLCLNGKTAFVYYSRNRVYKLLESLEGRRYLLNAM